MSAYPALTNQRDRDNIADILARWRKERANSGIEASNIDPHKSTDNMILWQSCKRSQQFFDIRIDGAREVLAELFGER